MSKPRIRQIFVDLDDVLNTLAPHMLRAVGCQVAPDDYAIWPRGVYYEIEIVANAMLGTDYSFETFWQAIPPEAWVTIPKTCFADSLLAICASLVGKQNVYIATATTDAPCCASGKMEWIQRYLPSWIHRQFLLTPCKYLVSNPESLLIDDNQENIIAFQKRGGHTITAPRPWNEFRGCEPSGHIVTQLYASFEPRG